MTQILQFSATNFCSTLKLHELNDDAIQTLPVSSYKLPDGNHKIISYYRDNVWRLEDNRFPSNVTGSKKKICFDSIPSQFVEAVKYTLKHYDIETNPRGNTFIKSFDYLKHFLTYLDGIGIKSTTEITPLLCANYVHQCKQITSMRNKPLSIGTLTNRFLEVEKLYKHLKGTTWAFEHPWIAGSASQLAGFKQHGKKTAKTKIIPDEQLKRLIPYCHSILENAHMLIELKNELQQMRTLNWKLSDDAITRRQNKVSHSKGYSGLREFHAEYNAIPIAVAVIILTFSGVRVHELCAIQSDAYRIEDNEDDVYYWLKSHSSKTYEGYTEWLVPEIVIKAIEVQKAYIEPLREALFQQQKELLAIDPNDQRGLKIEAYKDHLFLVKRPMQCNQISALSYPGFLSALRKFGASVGIKDLAPHRFRRTFAVYVARSAYGDLRYLKKHFKHWSMDMTLLYAFNEEQDIELYDEIATQIKAYKIERVAEFLEEDTILSGGLANKLVSFRSNSEMVKTFESRAEMAEKVSDTVHIRSTGHSWCTSDVSGCGGRSVIEGTRCIDCDDSIIERERHGTYFKGVYIQQLELRQINDIGEAGKQRVERDIERCERVLNELGLWDEVQETVI